MARPPRPLTPAEQARPCGRCGAQKGQRCTNPNGSTYPHGEHAVRRGEVSRRAPGESSARDSGERYSIDLCGHCGHPGGGHAIDQWEPRVTHCRLCTGCPGWDEAHVVRGWWSDRMAREAEAALRESGND